jgi:hypothetical protein
MELFPRHLVTSTVHVFLAGGIESETPDHPCPRIRDKASHRHIDAVEPDNRTVALVLVSQRPSMGIESHLSTASILLI